MTELGFPKATSSAIVNKGCVGHGQGGTTMTYDREAISGAYEAVSAACAEQTLRTAQRTLNANLIAMAVSMAAAGVAGLILFGDEVRPLVAHFIPTAAVSQSGPTLERRLEALSAELGVLRESIRESDSRQERAARALGSLAQEVDRLGVQQTSLASQTDVPRKPAAALAENSAATERSTAGMPLPRSRPAAQRN